MHRLSRNIPTMLSLLKITEHGSINKAAEVLHISQPALTRSVGRLEAVLGVPLLERTARGVHATPFGEVVLARARNIEIELRNAERDIAALRNSVAGALRIGATPLVAGYFMPAALEAIYSAFPETPVRLVEGTRPELLGMLRRKELDFVVSTFPFDQKEPDLDQHPLFELDLRVVVRASHPLATSERLLLRDIAHYRWILPRADSALYKRVERDFLRAGVAFPGSVIETSSLETTRSLVTATDLVAILPLRAVTPAVANGTLAILSGDWSFEHRTVGVFLREGQEMPPSCRILMRLLRNMPAPRPRRAKPGPAAGEARLAAEA
ncbi:LysR family transcriptional regulator [Propylenella binzhouense]|uniref:LysR family transcriptional regulator n=1 Tax=Propylenella binzhouense TaxID=2555902 RepID=UPI00136DDBDB|nr:LysR family transcriptional regulator [Propylenella binzhouense]